MVGVVLNSPVTYVPLAQPLPAAQGNRDIRSVVHDASGAFVDELAHVRINAVTNPIPDHGAAFHGGFYSDYFNRVYLIPPVLALIDPVIGQPNKFVFWNTNFTDVQLAQIDGVNADGLSFDIQLPLTLGAVKLTTANILVGDDAPNEEQADYTFTLTNGDKSFWTVNLLRTNLLQVSPETPVVEVLKWKTAVDAATDGTEQRATLTHYVRQEYQVDYVMLTDTNQKTLYEQFATQLNGTFSYPIWTEQTRLLAPVSEGEAQMQINLAKFDMQAGDQLYFLKADEITSESVRVDSIGQDGTTVVLQSGFLQPWTVEDMIFRVTTVKVQDKPSIERAPYGFSTVKVTLRVTEFRDLFAPGISAQEIVRTDTLPDRVLTGLVYTLDGVPILNARPIVDGDTVKEDFDWNFEIFDYDIGVFEFLTDRIIANVTFDRKFYSKNLLQKFYWNWLLTWMDGRRRPVWLPTWLNDIGLDVSALAGSSIITVDEKFFSHYTATDSHKGVWIAYNGGYLARKIVEVAVDGRGHTVITLDKSVPDDFPQTGPYDIGFLILARQATDEVQREWHPAYNFLSTSFVSTKSSPEIT